MREVDVIFSGGRLVDGSGNLAVKADVAITDGRFVEIGQLTGLKARRVVNLNNAYLCPGFIDMHSHSDLRVLTDKSHVAKVAQGVTTEVIGQDGLSYAPVDERTLPILRQQLIGWNGDPEGLRWDWNSVGEYLDRLEGSIPVNVAYLAPHGTIRMLAMGEAARSASEKELQLMGAILEKALGEGAIGLSTGLTYTPAMFSTDEELVFLASIVAKFGGYYAPHHRGYGLHAMREYAACIDIAREAQVPLHLTHAHLGFEVNKGRANELLKMVDEATAEGLEVTLDSYPFLASSTYLHALLPAWVLAGSQAASVARLRDEELRVRIRLEIEETGHSGFHDVPVDWREVVIAGVKNELNQKFVGKTIAQSSADESVSPVEFFCKLLIDDDFGTTCVHHAGNEENVQAIMRHRNHMAGSDGILVGSRPHPRGWSTFPRYFAQYVRDQRVLTFEDAVRKFTSLPAQRLGFWDRGLIRPGLRADVAVIDLDGLRVNSTYEDPCQVSDGIPYVMVNGEFVIDEGQRTNALPGETLRRGVASRK